MGMCPRFRIHYFYGPYVTIFATSKRLVLNLRYSLKFEWMQRCSFWGGQVAIITSSPFVISKLAKYPNLNPLFSHYLWYTNFFSILANFSHFYKYNIGCLIWVFYKSQLTYWPPNNLSLAHSFHNSTFLA